MGESSLGNEKRRVRDQRAIESSADKRASFKKRIRIVDGCHLIGSNTAQHARVSFSDKTVMTAQRFALIIATGTSHEDRFACHLCLNKNCVNPDHLYWGTPKENSADVDRDGTRSARNSITPPRGQAGAKKARDIALEYMRHELSIKDIAERFNVSPCVVGMIVARKTWRGATAGLRLQPRPIRGTIMPSGERHYRAKLTEDDASKIIDKLAEGASSADVAKQFNVAGKTVNDIRLCKTWARIPRPVSFPRKRTIKRQAVEPEAARHVFRAYYADGRSVAETSRLTGVDIYCVGRIVSRQMNAQDTVGMVADTSSGSVLRKGSVAVRNQNTCMICGSVFYAKKKRKKTCSKRCLGLCRAAIAAKTHAAGRMPLTRKSPNAVAAHPCL